MATTIPELDGDNIKHCLLVQLDIDGTTYFITNAYKAIVWDYRTYTECGAFLQIGQFSEDIKTTNGDISLTLSGIPSNIDYIQAILGANIKGGTCSVSRAFFNSNYEVQSAYQRFKGIITNFSISEDENILDSKITNSVSISVASINTILENRIAGQRTNPSDRKQFFPTDETFNRVPELHNVNFDFGREYTGGNGGRGGGGRGGGGGPFDFGNFNMR
jgi:hypothetical protein|tara:strand:- start:1976 stop:2629 length:654 start_codon:yes stop_codon:yes gene_type:complete